MDLVSSLEHGTKLIDYNKMTMKDNLGTVFRLLVYLLLDITGITIHLTVHYWQN